jgi:hypothetical protein
MATFEQLTDEQRAALARVGHKLFHSPEVSKDAKRLLMKADPAVKFPEIETQDAVEKSLEKRDEKIQALENQIMQTEAQRRLDERRAEARAKGIDPEEVEKAMTERGIGKWETAMEFVELTHRSAPATASSIDNVGLSTVMPADTEKEFWKDPAAWSRKEAHAVVDELQARRRQAR